MYVFVFWTVLKHINTAVYTMKIGHICARGSVDCIYIIHQWSWENLLIDDSTLHLNNVCRTSVFQLLVKLTFFPSPFLRNKLNQPTQSIKIPFPCTYFQLSPVFILTDQFSQWRHSHGFPHGRNHRCWALLLPEGRREASTLAPGWNMCWNQRGRNKYISDIWDSSKLFQVCISCNFFINLFGDYDIV